MHFYVKRAKYVKKYVQIQIRTLVMAMGHGRSSTKHPTTALNCSSNIEYHGRLIKNYTLKGTQYCPVFFCSGTAFVVECQLMSAP